MNASTKAKTVCVWYDNMSDGANPAWIVSVDDIFSDGATAATQTIRVCGDEASALIFGKLEAEKRGLLMTK